jgi:septum formation protein
MRIILASGSPRRKELLGGMGFQFDVCVSDADESFPPDTSAGEIAEMLARRKAEAVSLIHPDALILAADTVVESAGEILNKPADKAEAIGMLRKISGRVHQVHTGFCLMAKGKIVSGKDTTNVWFRKLEEDEISFYTDFYQVLDKAGSYGIQDWIGLVAVEKIEGSYFTVMGLPTERIWKAIREFCSPLSEGILKNAR